MKKLGSLIRITALSVTIGCIAFATTGTAFAGDGGYTVGSYVTLGTYEQDGNVDNGAEPIEWLVVNNDGGKALLLSKYGLDAVPYNTELADVTWAECSLRQWLNDTFYNTAFSDEDKSKIVLSQITDGVSKFSNHSGNSVVQDRVFALSWEEAEQIGSSDSGSSFNEALLCYPTPYAALQGNVKAFMITREQYERYYKKHSDKIVGACVWWLRSPGAFGGEAMVSDNGELDVDEVNGESSTEVSRPNAVCVRPAIYVTYQPDQTEAQDTAQTTQTQTAFQPAQPGVFSATDVDNIMKTYANPAEFASMKNYKEMFDNYIIPFAEANGYKVDKYDSVSNGYDDYELNLHNGKYHIWCQTYWHTGGDKVDDYSFDILGPDYRCIYPVGAVIGADKYPTIPGLYTSATALQQLMLYLNSLSQ